MHLYGVIFIFFLHCLEMYAEPIADSHSQPSEPKQECSTKKNAEEGKYKEKPIYYTSACASPRNSVEYLD